MSFGKPVLNEVHVVPPSSDWYTPVEVATYSVDVIDGATAIAFVAVGRPVDAALQLVPPVVDFHTPMSLVDA